MTAARRLPLVAEPAGAVEDVTAAAERAATAWRLPDPELLRLAMNGVFACGDDVVLRVGRPSGDPLATVRVVDVARVSGVRVPVARRHDAFDGGGGLWVTAWERIHPTADPIDWERIGAMVAAYQRNGGAAEVAAIPWCGDFPWWRFELTAPDLLDGGDIDAAAVAGLRAALDRYADWELTARSGLVVGCHGDVHPGNVLMDEHGPVLLDWDLVCTGPPAWDHAALLTQSERWGAAPGIYDAYAAGYGRSLRGDPLAEALAELRLVAATLMRLRAARADPAAALEAEQRLRYWRGDPDAPQWRAQ